LEFELWVEGIWTFRNTFRRQNLGVCLCASPVKNAYDFRRQIVCPRVDPAHTLDKRECVAGTCEDCKDLRLLVGHGETPGLMCKAELSSLTTFKWEKWEWVPFENNDTKGAYDFKSIETNIKGLLDAMKDAKTGVSRFHEHHDSAKCLAADKKHKRANFPAGYTFEIQDFSENGTIKVKREHQTRSPLTTFF